MKRFASVAALIAAACAGAVASVLLAAGPAGADGGSTTVTTVTTTLAAAATTTSTGATTTTGASTAPVATPAAPKPKPKPAPKVETELKPLPPPKPYSPPARTPAVALPKLLTAGLSVGGTLVGGLTKAEARDLVEQRFERPLTLVLSPTRQVTITPDELGARANVVKALRTAATVRRQGFLVPLEVALPAARVRALLQSLAKEVETDPRDARLVLKGLRPVVIEAKPGIELDQAAAEKVIALALRTHSRDDVVLPLSDRPAKVQGDAFSQAIVIERGSNRLHFWVDQKLKRSFRVATGQAQYPSPLGRFTVINMQRHPWWYPPASSWAEGLEPVPPGPSNPLGTRWMGISSPNVGIHGTPNAASIGYSASHGCIRMLIPEVEWLFERVEMGTTVFIVPA